MDKRCKVCNAPRHHEESVLCEEHYKEWVFNREYPLGSIDGWIAAKRAQPGMERLRRLNRLKHG